MNLSPQSQQLYKQLLYSDQPLDAKQLAESLSVVPNAVYRLAEPLVEMGLVAQVSRYPAKYEAKPADEGLSLFLMAQNDWFSQQFAVSKSKTVKGNNIPQSQQVNLGFIQGRDELMNLSAVELEKATKAVDLIRSGHEIPAEVMLALIQAKSRDVKIRMLIQDYTSENAEMVKLWQKNGIEVRLTPLKQIRLMMFDNQNTYFMSYKHTDSKDDLGMKIDYPPFTAILSQLFDSWWENGQII